MKKWIIIWNAGYGDNAEIVRADNHELAEKSAYEAWRDDAESQADYRAEEYSEQLAEDYNLED